VSEVSKKTAELRALPDEELLSRVESAKEELFNLRFQHATGQLDDASRQKVVRHEIARILTILRERHLGSELEQELARSEAEALERGREEQASGRRRGVSLKEREKEALDAEETGGEGTEEEEE
jgi:large subunit ribosomal protein L29